MACRCGMNVAAVGDRALKDCCLLGVTPVEAGLAKFCNSPESYIGRSVGEKRENGPRQIRPIEIGVENLPSRLVGLCGWENVGLIASATWSLISTQTWPLA